MALKADNVRLCEENKNLKMKQEDFASLKLLQTNQALEIAELKMKLARF